VRDRARTHRQSEPLAEQCRNFAVREAELFIEQDDQRYRVRAQMRTRGTERVGRLQRMPPLDATLAVATPADVDPKQAHLRTDDRYFLLDLIRDARLAQRTTARRTLLRQRHVNRFVDLARRRSVAMPTVAPTGAAARLLWVWRGRAFRERRGLPLARPLRCLQRRGQSIIFAPQTILFAFQPRVLVAQPLVFVFGALDLLAQPFQLSSRVVDRCWRRALRHAPVMPESPRQYKRDPLTSYD
jgi:hypothetical protein